MSRRARMFLGVLVTTAVAALAPSAALAGAPVLVPAPDAYGVANATEAPCGPANGTWVTCLLPSTNAIVEWPTLDPITANWPGPRNFILPNPGTFATWLGETRTENGFPLIWRDVGSGFPISPASGPYSFPLAGKYFWECNSVDRCVGAVFFRLKGTMYVIGPRPMLKAKLVSPDNSGSSITYGFDASDSFVVDYQPWEIERYEFDFNDDGVYDQDGVEPTGQASLTPGPHYIRLRVTDNSPQHRVATYALFLEIPYVRPGNPEPNPIADNSPGTLNPTGVKFSKANIKLKAAKRIKVSVLRKKGLSVKVSGLTKGDRIRARLLRKKSTVAAGAATTAGSSKTVRLRVGRKGRGILRSAPRSKRLVLDVAIEGADGYTATKRVAVRVS